MMAAAKSAYWGRPGGGQGGGGGGGGVRQTRRGVNFSRFLSGSIRAKTAPENVHFREFAQAQPAGCPAILPGRVHAWKSAQRKNLAARHPPKVTTG